MKRFAQSLGSVFFVFFTVVVLLFGVTRPVLADSYSIVDLGTANGHGIYGIDTAGDVVVWGTNGCGRFVSYCFVTYVDGVATNDGSVAPILAYDDGGACSSTPAGFDATKETCNGEWTGLGSLFSPNGDPNGVYLGIGSSLDFIHSGSADQLFLNSIGDFAWIDGQNEHMYELIQNAGPLPTNVETTVVTDPIGATTPEPRTLLLVATGFIWIAMMLRRSKAYRHRSLAE
jgi:hypothetical protein